MPPDPNSTTLPLLIFFQLQLDRILNRPSLHAGGPKKPNLAQTEASLDPRKDK